jgi:hypothetical protein
VGSFRWTWIEKGSGLDLEPMHPDLIATGELAQENAVRKASTRLRNKPIHSLPGKANQLSEVEYSERLLVCYGNNIRSPNAGRPQ